MIRSLDVLSRVLQQAPPRLVDISDEDAARRPAAGGWSKKEIIGHLIDSVANNHQRIVRAMLAPALEFPQYEQDAWVSAQAYATARWPDLVNLWLLYNRHLLHVARQVPEAKLATPCKVGSAEAVTLEAMVAGYVDHLQHHLQQVLEK